MAFQDIIECTIDFSGQQLSDQLLHVLLTAFGVLSLVVGYSMQSLQMLLIVFAGGLVTTALVVIPPWPMYNKNPQKWVKPAVKNTE